MICLNPVCLGLKTAVLRNNTAVACAGYCDWLAGLVVRAVNVALRRELRLGCSLVATVVNWPVLPGTAAKANLPQPLGVPDRELMLAIRRFVEITNPISGLSSRVLLWVVTTAESKECAADEN